jgi:subtilisin family serine protease
MIGSERAEHGPLIGQVRRWAVLGLATVTATGAALGAGAPSWAAPSEGVIRGNAADAVANSFIVVLKDGSIKAQSTDPQAQASAVTSAATTLTAKYGGKVTQKYSASVHGYAVDGLSDAQAKKLAGDSSVSYVQRNLVIELTDTQDTNTDGKPGKWKVSDSGKTADTIRMNQATDLWNLDRIDQRGPAIDGGYTYPNSAGNVTAYVIDTGIRISHLDFNGRASYGYNALDGSSDASDCRGHGTHVAGTIGGSEFGVAKDIKLVAVKVFPCTGGTSTATVVAGVDWVTSHAAKPAVVNMSLGGPDDSVLKNAVKASIASGLTYTVSAGNEGQNACNVSPANIAEAITVGASDSDTETADWRANFPGQWASNYGSCLDIWAPGVWIWSDWYTGDDIIANLDGTSMASPHVAGAAALILSAHPTYTPAEVNIALGKSSTTGVIEDAGAGSPNKLLFVRQVDPPQVASRTVSLYNPKYGTTEVYARSTNDHLVYTYYYNGWASDWIDLGGDLVGDPSVIYNPTYGTTEVYARNKQNHIMYRYYYNGWANWIDLGDAGGGVTGNPSVLYNPKYGTTEVYTRTTSNQLQYRYYYNGWQGWINLGGDVASDPALLYNPKVGTTEVYVRTAANKLAYVYYYNGWKPWTGLDSPTGDTISGNPAVIFNPTYGTTEVYTRTGSNTLAYRYYYNGWKGWIGLGGSLAGDPGLVYNPRYGTTEAYARTSSGSLQYVYYYNGWSGWNNLGGSIAQQTPSVLVNPKVGDTEVYVAQPNGHASYILYYNGWSGFMDLSL